VERRRSSLLRRGRRDNATTFDSRATPEVGKKRKAPTKRAPVDLDTLRERMAATIEEAEAQRPEEAATSPGTRRAAAGSRTCSALCARRA
jgi:hypothetical protein